MQVEAAVLFESPEQIYARVFRHLKPRTPLPEIEVRFCRFANANSFARLADGKLEVRVSDVMEAAPAPVLEALAFILLAKLFRLEPPPAYKHRYRRWLSRGDVRRSLHVIRQSRGRKEAAPPRGEHYDLVEIFERLNLLYFHGLMARPDLGWSRRPSRSTLGHYDPSHHTIILGKWLDRPAVPPLAVEYVMFHEMLHLRYPARQRGLRRCVHMAEFREAGKQYPHLTEAKRLLKALCRIGRGGRTPPDCSGLLEKLVSEPRV